MDFEYKENYTIQDLLAIVQILRAPDGCPWDREQTHQSIRKNLIEETYEVADAIDQRDTHLLCEELGDLLLQVALHVQMETEAGRFTFEDVCDGICKKLIYRHPHVFSSQPANLSTGQVLQNWEALKNAEKGRETAADRLDSVPAALPALMRSEKVQKRAAAFGFAYQNTQAAFEDLVREVEELREALQTGEGQAGEVGDVLFSAVNVARFVGVDAEEALTQSCDKFADRVKCSEAMANAQGKRLEEVRADERDALWKAAKEAQKGR